MEFQELSKLVCGKRIKNITGAEPEEDLMRISFTDGSSVTFYHNIVCSESVTIEDVCGDPDDFSGEILTLMEERTNFDVPEGVDDGDNSSTWTFYEFACIKGSMTVRWYGSSNGYYSEEVDVLYDDGENKHRIRNYY